MSETDRQIVWRNGDTVAATEVAAYRENEADRLNTRIVERLQQMSRQERLDLVQQNAETAFREGLRIGDEPVPIIPFPILQDKESNLRHAGNILKVHTAAVKIEEFAFSGHPMGSAILQDVQNGMFPEGRKLMMAARNVPHDQAMRRVVRFDTFSSGNGLMNMIEANTIATEGILYHDVITKTGIRVMQGMSLNGVDFENERKVTASRQVFTTLLEMVHEKNGKLPGSIGIVYEPDGEDNAINRTELPYVADTFSKLAKELGTEIDIVIGRPSEVDAKDGKMSVSGKEVDIIWRNNINPQDYQGLSSNGGRVNADGLLEIIANPDQYLILNDDRTRFEGYKETMAYLHNPRIQSLVGLTPEEIAAIDETVPFTFDPSGVDSVSFRGQAMDTGKFLTTFSDHFVIKPKVGTHGAGVAFGLNNGPVWEKAVDEAIHSGKFIAQQYIPYESIIYATPTIDGDGNLTMVDHYMDTNMHVIGGRVIGTSICRSSPVERFHNELGVLNVAAGGGVRPSLRI